MSAFGLVVGKLKLLVEERLEVRLEASNAAIEWCDPTAAQRYVTKPLHQERVPMRELGDADVAPRAP